MKKISLLAALLISAASYAQIAGYTSFEEPGIVTIQYVDLDDPAVAHNLANNVDEPLLNFTSTGGEMGFNARYEPYDNPSVGLTDGDWVGVTGFTGDVGAFPDGAQGYSIGDVDGNYILEFDPVDLTGYTGVTLSIDWFINNTPYEGNGSENSEDSDLIHIYVKDLTNGTEIDVINTLGINISVLTLNLWLTSSISLPDDITAQLVVKVRTNAALETIYFDNIVIDGILGIGDNNQNQFAIYPNPANEYVNITSQTSGDKNVAVFDILGKQVINTTVSERLDISNLTSGMYLVKITQNGVSSTKKLVVR